MMIEMIGENMCVFVDGKEEEGNFYQMPEDSSGLGRVRQKAKRH